MVGSPYDPDVHYAKQRSSTWIGYKVRLRELADLDGDVNAFITAAEAGGRPEKLAGDIAKRLIAHGRATEALA